MNIQEIIKSGASNICVTVSLSDLREFFQGCISDRLAEIEVEAQRQIEKEEYLSPKEAAEKLGVSASTLWRWSREQYLVPVKVGRKSLYKQSDINKLLEGVTNE